MPVYDLANEPDPKDWFLPRITEYLDIANRLKHTRHRYERAKPDIKKKLWFRAYLFSVLSVQTRVEAHELSFKELVNELGSEPENYLDSDRLIELMARTKCGHYKTKSRVIIKTAKKLLANELNVDITKENCQSLRKEYWKQVSGLRYIKISFMFAMLGYPMVCIDTWVARYLGLDYQNGDSQKLSDQIAFYQEHENQIVQEGLSQIGDWSKNPFLYQWLLFDYQRQNGVTQHDIYFESMELVE